MLVTPSRMQIYYVKQNVIEDYPIVGKLGSLAASPLPRLASLQEQFTITRDDGTGLPGADDRTTTLVTRLVPTAADVRQYVDHIRVRLDPDRGIVTAFEMVDPDGERTTITFSNIRTNTGLADKSLELDAPRDAKIVKPLEPGK